MFAPYLNSFEQVYTNHNSASNTPGTAVTPGASNAEGAYTAIASSANIASDVYWVRLWVAGGGTAAQAKNHLLDIGVDPAGGTAYSEVISNLVCGGSSLAGEGGQQFMFPLFIKAGSSVAVRIQGSHATAGTVRVSMDFMGNPSRPEVVRVGSFSETIGTITNSLGVSLTPGDNNAEGTWVSLGTTAKAMWWWQVGVQFDDTQTTNITYHFDLAYGDATNKIMILENVLILLPGSSERYTLLLHAFGYRDVPAGSEIFIRGTCGGTSDAGCNAVAIGIGG
jgi:hypothetical protein